MAIVFPCPNCGATQSVNDDETSTQCQFCGNSITVPEGLRPKTAAPAPAPAQPQAISFAGLSGFPGLANLPLNLDIGKIQALGHAVRAGDKAQAAQLYQTIFGVDAAQAAQMVDAMLAHHGATFQMSAMSSGFEMPSVPPMIQMGSAPPAQPSAPYTIPAPGGYITPATPMMVTGQRSGRSGAAGCFSLAMGLFITVVVAGSILAAFLFSSPGLMSALTGAVKQATNQYPRVVMTFGGKGSGQGLFADPRTIAVDDSGAIYVGDYSDGRVQVFNPQGKFIRQFKITDEKQPYLMALAASSGKIYAVVAGSLYAYDSATGKSLGAVNIDGGSDLGFTNFTDVAARPGGGLAAASFAGDDNLVLLNSDLQFERVITDVISQVSGNPELDMRLGLDGSGNIFILGTFNNGVFHYGPDGQYANRFGSEGGAHGQFQAPSDIAVDQQGQVYVNDDKGIQVFSPDGRYLSTIGVPDNGYIFGMTFDAQDALYAIANNGKVYKFLLAPPK